MEMLDWVKDCRQMNLITNVAKKFTMSPNPIVKIKPFEAFTTIERI